ncbi:hypothetical protein ACPPVO_35100 [Dactylosporangium sp. McL0621]|uniref:hypothetical protein n=1 Tax=Dactylosporangium sp. McL0621 TaxID=3415678 RepID=UPI003CF71794
MPDTSVTIVCLPQDTPASRLAAEAADRLETTARRSLGSAGYFVATSRLHRSQLLQPWQGTAAGGPVHLLGLDAMRAAAWQACWHRWHVWYQVVGHTRPAQPYWTSVDRHLDAPSKYPLRKAQEQYRAQPRIAAMLTYNALPNRLTDLPSNHLEAFQAGAHSYAAFGWLAAVPGDGVLSLDRTYLGAVPGPYATQLAYLAEANARINALHRRDRLVAVCTR